MDDLICMEKLKTGHEILAFKSRILPFADRIVSAAADSGLILKVRYIRALAAAKGSITFHCANGDFLAYVLIDEYSTKKDRRYGLRGKLSSVRSSHYDSPLEKRCGPADIVSKNFVSLVLKKSSGYFRRIEIKKEMSSRLSEVGFTVNPENDREWRLGWFSFQIDEGGSLFGGGYVFQSVDKALYPFLNCGR